MKREWTVGVVVATLAMSVLMLFATLCWCAITQTDPAPKIMETLKDVGLIVIGALGALLTKTTADHPTETTIVNRPDEPIPTTATDAPGK